MGPEEVNAMNTSRKNGFYGDNYRRSPPQWRMRLPGGSGRWATAAMLMAACVAVMAAVSLLMTSLGGVGSVPAQIPLYGNGAPGSPFFVIGFTLDSVGVPISGCHVNITDKTTGGWNNSTVSDSSGYYHFDVSSLPGGYSVGDVLNATVHVVSVTGWNQTVITSGPHQWLNVTIGGVVIPEFPGIALPIVGTLTAFVAAATIMRRGREAEL